MNIPHNPTPPPIQPAQSVLVFDRSFYVIIFRRQRYFRRLKRVKNKTKNSEQIGRQTLKKKITNYENPTSISECHYDNT